MVNNSVPQDAILNKAFQLGYFIHGDKKTAMQVVLASLERLETAVAAQDRRLYYTPAGKPSSQQGKQNGLRYKVSLSEAHLLQRLIYLMSEPFEIEKEGSVSAPHIGEEDMIIHYLKHLVQITVRRNSFYVALGISRLLYNYTTGETLDIYSAIGQPERISDDDYIRARKRRLMQEIKQRFGSMVNICRGPRAEERFVTQDCSGWKAKLVERCLELFVPWNTPCLLAANSTSGNLSGFYGRERHPDEEHSIEVARFHAFIHPYCYENLTRGLHLTYPGSGLQMPHFFLSKSNNGTPDGRPPSPRDHLPSLDEQDLLTIKQHLGERSARRRAAARGLLRILVDGTEHARLDLKRARAVHLSLPEGANIIEVIADDERGELILATHLLTYEETHHEAHPSQLSIVLEGGQKLCFRISHSQGSSQEDGAKSVEIIYQEANPIRSVLRSLSRRFRHLLDPLGQLWQGAPVTLKPALVGAALGLIAAAYFYLQGTTFPTGETPAETINSQAPATPSGIVQAPPPPVGQQAQNPGATTQPSPGQNPSGRKGNRHPHRQAVARDYSPRPPSTAAATEFETARSPEQEVDLTSLLEAEKICIQTGGKDPLNQQVQTLLADRLQATNRFTLTDLESADACLKIVVRRQRTPVNSDPKRLHKANAYEKASAASKLNLTVRLVNADGHVIWPITGTARRYSGHLEQAAGKVIKDLIGDVERLESSRE
jgi:hypothetical protein